MELTRALSPEDWDAIDRITSTQAQFIAERTKERQRKKFDRLVEKQKPEELPTSKVIVNLTDENLDTITEKALMKGFNFAIAPKKIPIEKIICGIESAIRDIPVSEAEEIRQDVSCLIRRSKPPTNNITKPEIEALRKLRENPNILVLPADKGNASVIMYKDNYTSKMMALLEDCTYAKIRNPTLRVKTEINKLIKDSSLEEEDKRRLVCTDPKPPLLYGLPKIHKDGIPMRPIVSAIGSATQEIARHLAKELQPLTGQTSSYVQNSTHFVKKLTSLQVENEDLLVSFDIVSLFTNLPIDDTIALIKSKVCEDKAKIIEYCLKSTYFLFDGDYYKQIEGAPMGSPLSPVAANLFLENFEDKALASANKKPFCWWRYVDDVFLLWKHGRQSLDDFLRHMNSIHEKIQFTMEIEEKGSLPFLDVLVTKKSNGTLGHTVYRKPTHTDRYLNAASHHHPMQKKAVIQSLVSRGFRICDSNSWEEEKQHLKSALAKNGFKKEDIVRTIRREETTENRTQAERVEDQRKAYLPFIEGTTDKISRILRKHGIKTTFNTHMTTRSLLKSPKDQLHLKTCGVYQIPCSCGKNYIGQTGRLISTRLQEHVRAVRNSDHRSAVAQHSDETGHCIKFEDIRVLASVNRYHSRIIREAIEIEKQPENFNREDGFTLSRTWKPLIGTCTKQTARHGDPGTSPTRQGNTNEDSTCQITSSQQRISPSKETPGTSSYNLRSRKPI